VKYRLTIAAQQDMDQILEQGIDDYGVEAAIDYYDKIEERFLTLITHPYQYPAVNEIRVGYRRSVCGVHSIYYRVDAKEMVIARILNRQNPLKHLPE